MKFKANKFQYNNYYKSQLQLDYDMRLIICNNIEGKVITQIC